MITPPLADRVVLVLGGTRGVGRACALDLARAGARVIISGRSAERAAAVAEEVRALGVEAELMVHDIADVDSTKAAIDTAVTHWGRIDGLIASAGINPFFLKTEKVTPKVWDELVHVNLRGVFFAVQAAGIHMLEAGRGSIVMLSSVTASRGTKGGVPYVAAKGGLEALTRTMALEWATRGVRVNAIAPGYVETDMTDGLRHHEGLSSMAMSRTPMGRYGTPEEIAGLATFLLSDAAAYLTAQVIAVDGGLTVG